MDIAVVARKAGVPASTLRFYEQKGLIRSNGRADCGARTRPAYSTGSH